MSLTREELAARVRQAIDGARVSHADLAWRIGLDPTALSKALAGKRDFKSLEVASIAEEIDVPVHHLLADASIPSPAVAARAQPGVNEVIENATRQASELLDLDELLADAGWPADAVLPLDIPRLPDRPVAQATALADAVRARLDLTAEKVPPREPSPSGCTTCASPMPTGVIAFSGCHRPGRRCWPCRNGWSSGRRADYWPGLPVRTWPVW